MSIRSHRALAATVLAAALASVPGAAARPPAFQPIGLPRLDVTEGTVAARPHHVLVTSSGAMRATERDRGHHAARARLTFQLLGSSADTTTLGSGRVRQQIGLKLRAADPCNLVYVMWRTFPDSAISVLVKRNPGKTTSSACGNGGYTDVATIPVAAIDAGTDHTLEVRTAPAPDGSLVLAIRTDGTLLRTETVAPALAAGLDGPVGVRSDDGSYRFRIAAAGRE